LKERGIKGVRLINILIFVIATGLSEVL